MNVQNRSHRRTATKKYTFTQFQIIIIFSIKHSVRSIFTEKAICIHTGYPTI